MFTVTDRHAFCIFLRTSWDASQLAPSPLPLLLSTSLWVRPQCCCTVKSRTRCTSVSAPIWVARISSSFLVFSFDDCSPGASHLHRYNLLLLVVYYPRINSVGPEILVLSVDWDVPVCLCIRSLIYRLWVSWWIPRWRRFNKSQVFYDDDDDDDDYFYCYYYYYYYYYYLCHPKTFRTFEKRVPDQPRKWKESKVKLVKLYSCSWMLDTGAVLCMLEMDRILFPWW